MLLIYPSFNFKFAKDNKEDSINKAIMDAQGGDGSLKDVLNMAERESDSNIWLRSTRSHRRGLICLPYHLLKAKCYNYIYDLMTDLQFAQKLLSLKIRHQFPLDSQAIPSKKIRDSLTV